MAEELIGIIGGTGLGDALESQISNIELRQVRTPFGRPSAPVVLGRLGARKVAFLNRHGKGHKLPPSDVPFAANIFALKSFGVHTIISTGAVGSLRKEFAPGDLVVVDQFIDKTFKRQNTFFTGFGAVHCEMAEPTCSRLRKLLCNAAKTTNIKTHSTGTYICMEGPQFSTRAESLMHRSWGGDLIGMTAMPEAKLAREAQICYALVALPSDYDSWRPHKGREDKHTLLQEIMANLQTAADNCRKLIETVLRSKGKLVCEDCFCRKALDLAIWTNKSQITPADKKRLKPLFE